MRLKTLFLGLMCWNVTAFAQGFQHYSGMEAFPKVDGSYQVVLDGDTLHCSTNEHHYCQIPIVQPRKWTMHLQETSKWYEIETYTRIPGSNLETRCYYENNLIVKQTFKDGTVKSYECKTPRMAYFGFYYEAETQHFYIFSHFENRAVAKILDLKTGLFSDFKAFKKIEKIFPPEQEEHQMVLSKDHRYLAMAHPKKNWCIFDLEKGTVRTMSTIEPHIGLYSDTEFYTQKHLVEAATGALKPLPLLNEGDLILAEPKRQLLFFTKQGLISMYDLKTKQLTPLISAKSMERNMDNNASLVFAAIDSLYGQDKTLMRSYQAESNKYRPDIFEFYSQVMIPAYVSSNEGFKRLSIYVASLYPLQLYRRTTFMVQNVKIEPLPDLLGYSMVRFVFPDRFLIDSVTDNCWTEIMTSDLNNIRIKYTLYEPAPSEQRVLFNKWSALRAEAKAQVVAEERDKRLKEYAIQEEKDRIEAQKKAEYDAYYKATVAEYDRRTEANYQAEKQRKARLQPQVEPEITYVTCKQCAGYGTYLVRDPKRFCLECMGNGSVQTQEGVFERRLLYDKWGNLGYAKVLAKSAERQTCNACKGSGNLHNEYRCEPCNGHGKVKK